MINIEKEHGVYFERPDDTDRWLIAVYEWNAGESVNVETDLIYREQLSPVVDYVVSEECGDIENLKSLLRCLRRQCARLEMGIEEYTPVKVANESSKEKILD